MISPDPSFWRAGDPSTKPTISADSCATKKTAACVCARAAITLAASSSSVSTRVPRRLALAHSQTSAAAATSDRQPLRTEIGLGERMEILGAPFHEIRQPVHLFLGQRNKGHAELSDA